MSWRGLNIILCVMPKNKNKSAKMQLVQVVREATLLKPKQQQQQPKKSKKRSNKKKNIISNAPTIDKVQRDLKSMSLNNFPQMDPYIMCRLNPLKYSGKGVGIPDGAGRNFLVQDWLIADNIQLQGTNTGFVIQTTNCLPYTSIIRTFGNTGSTNITVNGSNFNDRNAAIPGGVGNYSFWAPIGVPANFASSSCTPGANYIDPTSSSSIRLVSIARRLVYTGQSAICSGTISVTPNSIAFSEVPPTGNAGMGYQVLYWGATGPTSITLGEFTPVLQADFVGDNSLSTLFNKGSVVNRCEQGAFVPGKHLSVDYEYKPTFNSPRCVVPVQPLDGNLYGNLTTTSPWTGADSSGIGVVWYDNDWQNYSIVVSGAPANSTFRYETAICYESIPLPNSPLVSYTKDKSQDKPALIKQADKMLSNMPAALPA